MHKSLIPFAKRFINNYVTKTAEMNILSYNFKLRSHKGARISSMSASLIINKLINMKIHKITVQKEKFTATQNPHTLH